MPLYIRSHKHGHSHPKCYLGMTKGCSSKISGEHCISRALLDHVEKQNQTIDVTGLSWLPKEQLKSIGKSALVSNILCTDHNSALSPLDGVAANFIGAIGRIDKDLQQPAPTGLSVGIDGELLERWVLKTLWAMVRSGQIKLRSGELFKLKESTLKLLCEPQARWQWGWGLYFAVAEGRIHHSSSFEFIPQVNESSGLILGVILKFNGMKMHFLMGKPGDRAAFGIHRPSALEFVKGAVRSRINLSWGGKAAGPLVELTQVGTYTGPAPGQGLPRAK